MAQKRRRFIPAALVLAGFIGAAPRSMPAQEECCAILHENPEYSLASLHGNYSAVATYGGNVAQALGTQTVDGMGKLKGSAIVNQPGPGGSRAVVSITFTGTYGVNPDGTGTMHLSIALPNGTTAEATEDFVITKAEIIEGTPIATEIVDAQEQPSTVIPGGIFVTHTYALRPSR